MTSTLTDLAKRNANLAEAVKSIDVSRCGHLAIGWIDGSHAEHMILSVDSRVDANTIYEIGSITKGVTGLALAQVVLNGAISLDEPIYERLPFEDKTGLDHLKPITFESLATHTSGLPRIPYLGLWYAWKNRSNPYAQVHNARFKTALTKTKLHKPGTGNYSNCGFGLLGLILSHIQLTSYARFVEETVLGPLGMEKTVGLTSPDPPQNFAPALKKNCNGGQPWTFTDATAGAGGLGSNLNDMSCLLEALLHPEKTSLSEAIQLATEPRNPFLDDQMVGLGWLTQAAGSEPILWHNGGTGCFSSFIGINKAQERGIVLLLNRPLSEAVTEAGLNFLAG